MVVANDSVPRSQRRLAMAQMLVVAVGAFSHLALLLRDFHPQGMEVFALLFVAWVVLPWVLIWRCARLARGRQVASWGAFGLALLYLALGTWAYVDALFIHLDPQSPLIFLFVPLLGASAAFAWMAGLWLSPQRPPPPR